MADWRWVRSVGPLTYNNPGEHAYRPVTYRLQRRRTGLLSWLWPWRTVERYSGINALLSANLTGRLSDELYHAAIKEDS